MVSPIIQVSSLFLISLGGASRKQGQNCCAASHNLQLPSVMQGPFLSTSWCLGQETQFSPKLLHSFPGYDAGSQEPWF